MFPSSAGGGGVLVLGELDGVLLGEFVGVELWVCGARGVELPVGPSVGTVVVGPPVRPSVGPAVVVVPGPPVGVIDGVCPGVLGPSVGVGVGVAPAGVPDGVLPGVVADGLATTGLVELVT